MNELARRNQKFTSPEQIMSGKDVEHVASGRLKDGKKPDDIGDMLNSVTTSTRRRFVTTKTGHPEGVVVPHGKTTYLGVFEPENGQVGIWTAYDVPTKKNT